MSLSAHDRQELGAIEEELAASDPQLAEMLSIFSRLADGEEMPGSERVGAVQQPAAIQAAFGLVPGRPGTPRGRGAPPPARQRGLSRKVILVVWLAMSFTLIAIAVVVSQTGPRASCAGWPPVGCGNHAPARPASLP